MDPTLKAKYLDCGGTFCPFCGSHDTEDMGGTYIPEGDMNKLKGCNVCHEQWVDVYELKEVRYVPGDDRANAEVPERPASCATERA